MKSPKKVTNVSGFPVKAFKRFIDQFPEDAVLVIENNRGIFHGDLGAINAGPAEDSSSVIKLLLHGIFKKAKHEERIRVDIRVNERRSA